MADVEGSSGGDVGAVGEPTPASDVGHVDAEGEPMCHGGGERGGDVGAEGEPTSASDGEHVGAEGEPTWQGGGGAGDNSRSAPSS